MRRLRHAGFGVVGRVIASWSEAARPRRRPPKGGHPHDRASSRLARRAGAGLALAFSLSLPAAAQTPAPPRSLRSFPNMTFFISSQPGPNGANFGGLEGGGCALPGARHRAGAGSKTWRAYLSQQAMGGKPAVNARDRIGPGPG